MEKDKPLSAVSAHFVKMAKRNVQNCACCTMLNCLLQPAERYRYLWFVWNQSILSWNHEFPGIHYLRPSIYPAFGAFIPLPLSLITTIILPKALAETAKAIPECFHAAVSWYAIWCVNREIIFDSAIGNSKYCANQLLFFKKSKKEQILLFLLISPWILLSAPVFSSK